MEALVTITDVSAYTERHDRHENVFYITDIQTL